MEVSLDIAADNSAESPDKVVDLAGSSATNGVGNTNAVDANLVDGAVDGEEIDEIGTERVLRRETDLEALGLDEVDNLNSSLKSVRRRNSTRRFLLYSRS